MKLLHKRSAEGESRTTEDRKCGRRKWNSRIDLMIVTPVFLGDAGGASIYYQSLTKLLAQRGISISVVSERDEGRGRKEYLKAFHPLFPKRGSLMKRPIKDLMSYAMQNFRYLRLGQIIVKGTHHRFRLKLDRECRKDSTG